MGIGNIANTTRIYGYIGGAYYAGYAAPAKNGYITGKVKPAIPPVAKMSNLNTTAHKH